MAASEGIDISDSAPIIILGKMVILRSTDCKCRLSRFGEFWKIKSHNTMQSIDALHATDTMATYMTWLCFVSLFWTAM